MNGGGRAGEIMNEKNDFALVIRPSSAVEKAAPGAKRILSGMVTDTLDLATSKEVAVSDEQVEIWYQTGEKYHYGKDISRDLAQAAIWYLKAAEAGHAEAKYKLKQIGEKKEKAKSVKKSAEQGNRQAQFQYAVMLASGKYAPYVPKNYKTAFEWFLKSAQQGYSQAQYRLGQIFEGESPYKLDAVPQDYGEAFKWYRTAAEQDHIEAQFELSSLYFRGLGVRQDYSEADKWFRKAFDQKHGPETLLLKEIYGWTLSKDKP